jgi:membrane protein insertase Oxa1/YidC/SpoIIIJ
MKKSPNGNSEVERLTLEAQRAAIEAEQSKKHHGTFNPITNCVTLYKGWNQPKPHPQTGDMINLGERVTWRIMGIYRKWIVFIALQVLTLVWWTNPHLFPGGLVGWNLLWSDLAVMVEMIVGIAFMAQSMRDAKVIRAELLEIQEQHAETHQLIADRAEDFKLIREIHAKLNCDSLPDEPAV